MELKNFVEHILNIKGLWSSHCQVTVHGTYVGHTTRTGKKELRRHDLAALTIKSAVFTGATTHGGHARTSNEYYESLSRYCKN